MLVAFSIDNFLSFASRQTLSMVPSLEGGVKGHRIDLGEFAVLKTAVIYGANASGKSNLLKGFTIGCRLIRGDAGFDLSAIRDFYAKTKSVNRSRPTLFEYTFYCEGKAFTYGFEILLDKSKVLNEWLYEIDPRTDRERLIFLRDVGKGTVEFGDGYPHMDLENLKDDCLALTHARDREPYRLALSWFQEKVKIHRDGGNDYGYAARFPADKEEFLALLGRFDTGIVDMKLENQTENTMLFRRGRDLYAHGYDVPVRFRHLNSDFPFSYGDESTGTQRLIDFTDFLVRPPEDGIFLIDEIDRGIHPLLGKKMIEEFNRRYADFPCQLVFTTHNASLLSDALLRRDEVWFVEKGEDGASRLFSLDIFKEHYADPKEAYLRGAFGAIPMLGKDENSDGD